MTTPDVPHHFELELTVPGTPDEVWDAIATADGISAWMMPTELDPRPGGEVVFHMGPGPEHVSRGRVTAWEPGRRLRFEEDWAALAGQDGSTVTPLATEFLIEARSGGSCVVRVVSSAFGTGADWENEFWDELDRGWPSVLDNLRVYLTHFPGQRATSMWVGCQVGGATPEQLIAAVRRAAGVSVVDAPVTVRGLTGRLVRTHDHNFLVRSEAPVPGLFSFYAYGGGEAAGVHVQAFLYSDAAPAYAERERAGWQAWLDDAVATVGAGSSA